MLSKSQIVAANTTAAVEETTEETIAQAPVVAVDVEDEE
jgi:hypothetical protein